MSNRREKNKICVKPQASASASSTFPPSFPSRCTLRSAGPSPLESQSADRGWVPSSWRQSPGGEWGKAKAAAVTAAAAATTTTKTTAAAATTTTVAITTASVVLEG